MRCYQPFEFDAPITSGSTPNRRDARPAVLGRHGRGNAAASRRTCYSGQRTALSRRVARLVLVPRESPLSAIHLENMLKLSRLGVRIVLRSRLLHASPHARRRGGPDRRAGARVARRARRARPSLRLQGRAVSDLGGEARARYVEAMFAPNRPALRSDEHAYDTRTGSPLAGAGRGWRLPPARRAGARRHDCTGELALALSRRSASLVVGLDFTPAMLVVAREKAAARGIDAVGSSPATPWRYHSRPTRSTRRLSASVSGTSPICREPFPRSRG